jgi:hypothetical protein
MSSSEDGLFRGGAALLFIGGTFMYKGLKKLKVRRKIKDIPTSKIDSAAIGALVEVKGQIVSSPSKLIEAPLSKRECAAFKWNLQYYHHSKNSRGWRDYKQFDSHEYVILNDGGNSNVAVKLSDIEIHGKEPQKVVQFTDSNFNLPEKAKEILNLEKMLDTTKKSFFLLSSKYRIIETCFYPKHSLYVLGSLTPKENPEEIQNAKRSVENKKKLNRFEKLIRRPIIIKRYDKNNDGYLDIEEQKAVINHLDESFQEYIKDLEVDELKRVKAVFKESKVPLGVFDSKKVHISFNREKDLIDKMGRNSWLMIIAGPIMFVLGIYFLVLAFSF